MIDLDALMKPISADQPCGTDLGDTLENLDPQVEVSISAAKGQDDPALWKEAIGRCNDVLSGKSKDVRLVVHMIRGMTVLHGFEGLRDGLAVASGYLSEYWDHLYPRTQEEGFQVTYSYLGDLDNDGVKGFIQRLNLCPLVEGSTQGSFHLWDYVEASSSNGPPGVMEKIQAAILEMDDETLRNRHRAILDSKQFLERIRSTVVEKAGSLLVTFTKCENRLDEAINALMHLAKERLEPKPAEVPEEDASVAGGSDESEPAKKKQAGALQSREDAFAMLIKVAEFFERTEPQSLLPTQIRRIVEWGKMTPDKLYSELIDDKAVRDKMFRLIGIRPPE